MSVSEKSLSLSCLSFLEVNAVMRVAMSTPHGNYNENYTSVCTPVDSAVMAVQPSKKVIDNGTGTPSFYPVQKK